MREQDPKDPQDPFDADPCDWVEAYVDGELSEEDRRRMDRRLASDSALAEELALARRIRGGLRNLPRQSCPEAVSRRALEQTVHRHEAPRARPWRIAFERPAWLAAAVAAALLAVVSHQAWMDLDPATESTTRLRSPAAVEGPAVVRAAEAQAGETPSPQEVAQAEEEIKLALAYLGKLGRTAEDSVLQLTAERRSRDATP